MDFVFRINAEHILVATSDPDDLSRTSDILEGAGYNVQKAYYAGDALFAIEHGQFDLALIDTRMSDRDNRPLIESITRSGQSAVIPWIALVDQQYKDRHGLLRQGAAAYLQYPFEPETLLRQVNKALQGHTMSIPPDSAADQQRDRFRELLERRLTEQRTLSALARSLSAVLDLDTLLTQVVEAAVSLSNAEEGLLLLPDKEEQALYIRAVKGIDSETARNFRIKTQDTLAGQVFRSGKPIVVGDQGWQKVKTEYLVKSLLYVPLRLKGETIGVLGINNRNVDRTFTSHDSELLQDLAAHAAVAIENARLYEESILRTAELSTLVRAGEAANSTLAIDQVLPIIAGQLIEALGLHQCYIGDWHADQHRLDTLAVRHRAIWRPADGPVIILEENPDIEDAFNQALTVTTSPSSAHSTQPLAAWLPHRYQAQAITHIPLFTEKHPLGLVMLYHIHALRGEQPASHQAHLRQIATEMIAWLTGSNLEAKQARLFRAAQRINDTAGADWCEIALWNPAQRHLNIVLSYGEAVWSEAPKPGFDLSHFTKLDQILTNQEPSADLASTDLRCLSDTGCGKSFLSVPLVIKGETAGLVILTDTLHTRPFSRREIELAQALVLQAANALCNARLYRDLELSLEELHRTQSKLVQTARLSAMGELAAAVAHQINNPLTTILVDTELILSDLSPDDPSAEALEAISRAGKRAHEVVRRLLGMARQHPPEELLEPLDINQTIRNTLMLVQSHIQQGSVSLSIRLANDLPLAVGIRGQLEDVWLNLLLNARDAVVDQPSPQIAIATRYNESKARVEVVVWDNGIGVAEDQQKLIFQPFFTTKPAGEGTGLGLHICQQIVEKCKGSIIVQSAYNEGTRFITYLPVYHTRDAS
ncbi:MAG: GAF domain-containing protein [Anaerolineae bacterium]|nr:GAF domain-containing protein [Anaerolineae bacterium]